MVVGLCGQQIRNFLFLFWGDDANGFFCGGVLTVAMERME